MVSPSPPAMLALVAFLGWLVYWNVQMGLEWFLTLCVLSIPHWLYAFIWTNPKKFMKISKSIAPSMHPVDSFSSIAALIKPLQFVTILVWYYRAAPIITLEALLANPLQLVAAVLLMAGPRKCHHYRH